MPEYLSPGVYMEELQGPKPIQAVGTSTGAFVGIAERGAVNTPQLVTNFTQFSEAFGGFIPGGLLAYGVQNFFNEGGTRCYVVRVFKTSGAGADGVPPNTASIPLRQTAAPDSTVVMRATAADPGGWGNAISVKAEAPGFDPADPANAAKKFKLNVFYKPAGAAEASLVESFDKVSMNEMLGSSTLANPDHVEKRINGVSRYIRVIDVTNNPAQIDPPFFTPAAVSLTGGTDGAALAPADLVGEPATATAAATGLNAFEPVDDVNIVAMPDLVNPAFTDTASRAAALNALAWVGKRKDCFFVMDCPDGLSPQTALDYRRGTGSFSGNAFNSKYGALYYPWIQITDPLTGGLKLMPPSGAVAGRYSATDVARGVHKAPAGTESGYINSAINVERVITQGEQDTLNPEGVNVIRKFSDSGILVWGARTISSDPEYRYVNVRRLITFLEESIFKGTQGLVFEPNDQTLWKRIRRDVGAFLRVQWLEGKLFGDKAEKAFFVKCDDETNPPESIDLGRVVTIVGVAPVKPAEFVIFRIQQTKAGGEVSE